MEWNVYVHRSRQNTSAVRWNRLVWYVRSTISNADTVPVIFHCFVWLGSVLFSLLTFIEFLRAFLPDRKWSVAHKSQQHFRRLTSFIYYTSCKWENTHIKMIHFYSRALIIWISHSNLIAKKFLFYFLYSKINDEWTKRKKAKSKSTVLIVCCVCVHVNICCLWIVSDRIELNLFHVGCCSVLLLLSSQEICSFLRTDCGGCQSMSNIIIINFLDHSVELMRASDEE